MRGKTSSTFWFSNELWLTSQARFFPATQNTQRWGGSHTGSECPGLLKVATGPPWFCLWQGVKTHLTSLFKGFLFSSRLSQEETTFCFLPSFLAVWSLIFKYFRKIYFCLHYPSFILPVPSSPVPGPGAFGTVSARPAQSFLCLLYPISHLRNM